MSSRAGAAPRPRHREIRVPATPAVEPARKPGVANLLDGKVWFERRHNLLAGDPPWAAPVGGLLLAETEHREHPVFPEHRGHAGKIHGPLLIRERVEQTGIDDNVERPTKAVQCEGVGHPELHRDSAVVGFPLRQVDCPRHQVDAKNVEALPREEQGVLSRAASRVEELPLPEVAPCVQVDEFRLGPADVPRGDLSVRVGPKWD